MNGSYALKALAALAGLAGITVAALALEASFASIATARPLEIIAHRGVHQPVRGDIASHETEIPWDACTAGLVEKTDHGYLENTLPSIQAAFDAGATVVEIDYHRTSDAQVVVFHDFYLNCRTDAEIQGCRADPKRTDGRCNIWDQPLAFLKGLDLGYGYTPDGGRTFPLRGRGKGLMPTLKEVLETFPDRKFLLDYKGDEGDTMPLVSGVLNNFPLEVRRHIYWYNLSDANRSRALAQVPESRILMSDKKTLKRCGLWYLTTGWLGLVPESCHDVELAIPFKYFEKLGRLGNILIGRLHARGSSLTVLFVETPAQAAYVKRFPVDGVFTNHIEVVGPLLRGGEAGR